MRDVFLKGHGNAPEGPIYNHQDMKGAPESQPQQDMHAACSSGSRELSLTSL